MKIALKRTPRDHCFGPLAHFVARAIDHSAHSHVEMVFSDGISASACMGEGVRLKEIRYTRGAWDFYTMPDSLELNARTWFEVNKGAPYDYFYMMRFLGWTALVQSTDRWGCVEALGASLNWRNSWRYGPGGFLDRCIDVYGSERVPTPF